MNLRIADPAGLVSVLHHVLTIHGELRLAVDGWRVVSLDGRLFYAAEQKVEVGGPYDTLGALLRDAAVRRHAGYTDPGDVEPAWEVMEWGGAFFRVERAAPDAPRRHDTLESALTSALG